VTTWDPNQYDRFKDERSRPFYDLLALVEKDQGMRVADLGCGTGALTRVLHTELGAKETLGIDTSQAMLAAAAKETAPGLSFRAGDLAEFRAEPPVDLLFSNAAVHWVADHTALFARLTEQVVKGGQLAVQMPSNHDHVSHVVAAEVARESPFREATAGYVRSSPVLTPEAYAEILDSLAYAQVRVRLEVYVHHLASKHDVIEWVKGTTLTAYKERMSEELYGQFLERYRARLLPLLPDKKPFFYPFKRVLLWGRRA
jgi:trans-aconitate 2-methyltransferase